MNTTKKCRIHFFFALTSLLFSCGYEWGKSPLQHSPIYASLDFIQGDEEGQLAYTLAKVLSQQGSIFIVAPSKAPYRLEVLFSRKEDETIGFRFDAQQVSHSLETNLVASEGRRSAHAKVTLYHKESQEIAFGPYEVSAFCDYDYIDGDSLEDLTFTNTQNEQTLVLPFSLGQLEPKEAAQSAADLPLFRAIAQKIADVLYAEG